MTAEYRVQFPRPEAEEEKCVRSLPHFRSELDIQRQILSLQRMLDREQSTRHGSLGNMWREIGVFMALVEVVSLPRFGRWQLITRKVCMKLQSRPRLVLMLCAHVFSFSHLSFGTSSLSWGLVVGHLLLLSRILSLEILPWASSQMGLTP